MSRISRTVQFISQSLRDTSPGKPGAASHVNR